MIDRLKQTLFEFLNRYWDKKKALLLAFSGGPDSLALLYLLLSYRQAYGLPLALAHVDHGWRPESGDEARQIALMAKKLELPLFLTKLHPEALKGNLEAACREERLKFFASLFADGHYQAVLLAHHADDFAETVLKRLFEGASLTSLACMRPENKMMDMTLWRPLLSISKREIIAWLESHSLKGFEDITNCDPAFLRGRLRTSILPILSKEFGKEISHNLCHIGSEAEEYKEYLEERITPHLEKVIEGNWGILLDLTKSCPESLVEIKYLIRRCCESAQIILSRECVALAAQLLKQGVANKCIAAGTKHIYIDRKHLFVMRKMPSALPKDKVPLKPGKFIFGPWHVSIDKIKHFTDYNSCWRSLWQGKAEIVLPDGEYELSEPKFNLSYQGNVSLAKWLSNHKVPAFLRMHIPVIVEKGELRHEFLTGKMKFLPPGGPKVKAIRIAISA